MNSNVCCILHIYNKRFVLGIRFISGFFLLQMQPCEKNSQCGDNQCCALRLRLFGYKGYCFKTKSLGEMCSPNVMVSY